MDLLVSRLGPWPAFALLALAVGLGVLFVHGAVYRLLDGVRQRTPDRLPLRGRLVTATERPARWTLLLAAARALWAVRPAGLQATSLWAADAALYVTWVLAVAWLALGVVRAAREALADRLDVGKEDNLSERRVLTQVGVFERVFKVVIVVVALAAVLLHFETFRRAGTGLLASAGVAGIVLGFAAQRVLGNLFAGIQIAVTQPIRVDDVVVVEGEWGRVEEITLTYVVVRVWDLRRLVLPISYFIETPFQNWTRSTAQVIGTVTLHTDYDVPVEAVRQQVGRIVEASPDYDGDVWRLHVTDLGERGVEMRAMATSASADRSWELRCALREGLLEWLRTEHPESLPHTRVTFPDAGAGAGRQPEPVFAESAGSGGVARGGG